MIFCDCKIKFRLRLHPDLSFQAHDMPSKYAFNVIALKTSLCRGAHEQQIWQVISRKILNLSLNAKICISKNMALI